MATPVLHDLAKAFPQAKITVLALPAISALLAFDPHLTEVISYKKPNSWIHRAEHHDVIEALQKGEYDLGILLTNSFSSAWWLWRGQVSCRIGFSKSLRSWLLDIAIPYPKNAEQVHLVNVYKELLVPLGISPSETKPALYLSQEDLDYRAHFFALNEIPEGAVVVGINPGAAYGSAKCWPPERFREVVKKLIDKNGVFVIFFGDDKSRDMMHKICRDMPGSVINMAGKTTLRELMALISGCSLFLTNDSGPMHIASALNVPLIALFGSTNPIKTGPFNGGQVVRRQVECSPCYKRECPIDFRCMKGISAAEVYQLLSDMIENNSE